MKNILLLLIAVFTISSCKVSDSITAGKGNNTSEKIVYDQVTKLDKLANKTTFKVVEQPGVDKGVAELNRLFKNQLVENGFTQVDENPELLIQGVVTSVNFEREVVSTIAYGTTGGGIPSSIYLTQAGQYGKIMFLIQDAATHEVLWMGIGTGLLTTENSTLNANEIKRGLSQLIATLK